MRTIMLVSFLAASVSTANSQVIWTNPVPIAHANANDVHAAIANGQGWLNQGEEMLAFSRNGKDICILRTTGNGASWSDSVKYITTDSADNDYPSLYHTGSGQPSTEIGMLVWQSRKNGNLDIYASKYGQLQWSAPQRITTREEDDRYPHVTWVSDRYFVVWEQRGRIVFSEYDGLAWSAPQFVTPTGDTLNSLPQVASVTISLTYQPLVVWERRKGADTTSALMYSYRNGAVWTTPDTLIYAGNNHRPRFFKYNYTYNVYVQWERIIGNSSLCYSGGVLLSSGRFQLQSIFPLTYYPDNQRNTSVNGHMIVVAAAASPLVAWYAVSAWESRGIGIDSIGVCQGPFSYPNHKLSAVGASSNRNLDASQGTRAGTSGWVMRFWVVWEANVSGKWQIHGSNTLVIIDEVDETSQNANAFRLEQNYPNPFNPTTTFQFSIVNSQLTILKVYDVLGQEVTTLVNEVKAPGTYVATWDATGYSSGVYFYRLTTGTSMEIKKLILAK